MQPVLLHVFCSVILQNPYIWLVDMRTNSSNASLSFSFAERWNLVVFLDRRILGCPLPPVPEAVHRVNKLREMDVIFSDTLKTDATLTHTHTHTHTDTHTHTPFTIIS